MSACPTTKSLAESRMQTDNTNFSKNQLISSKESRLMELNSYNIVISVFQILSRSKPAAGPSQTALSQQTQGRKQVPKVEDFLATRDYTGALTMLEVWKVA
jgi:dGTP triphosphohydrolase